MPTIIRDLPYFDQPTRVQLRGRSFSVKRDQIILWISITEKGIAQPDPRVPRFPAILDIGCNYNLLINERHLTAWAGIQPGYLRQLVRIRVADEKNQRGSGVFDLFFGHRSDSLTATRTHG